MQITINNYTLKLVEGDITALDVDAIVNAANQYLQLGSGVAGAIRRNGGPDIQKECDAIGGCPVGDAVMTTSGNLLARHVIHAVGPHHSHERASQLLADATEASLKLAASHHLKSIAFPAISTGVFGFPMDICAAIMLSTIHDFITAEQSSLNLVMLCLFGENAFTVFATELQRQLNER